MKKTMTVSIIGVFAAVHSTLYFLTPPFPWRNWAIYLEPLEGIILGPEAAFYAALIGSIVGRTIKPTDPALFIFGVVAEPLGALVCAFLAKGRWRSVLPIYGVMLAAYFAHPWGRWLPLWTIIDTLVALVLIYPASKVGKWLSSGDLKRVSLALPFISFIGIATDALVRVFLLVPAGLYMLLGVSSPESLYVIFVAGAVDSYIEDGLVVLVSFLVGVPLLAALRKMPGLEYPLT